MTPSPTTRSANEARAAAAVRGLFAALDTQDFEAARRRLGPRVELDSSSLWGRPPAMVCAEDLVESWRRVLLRLDAVRHDLRDLRSAVGGSTGMVVCTAEISHFAGDRQWHLIGHYRVGLARAGDWRVASLRFDLTAERGDRSLVGSSFPR